MLEFIYIGHLLFEENREFNIIKGQVPNQRYDVMLSYNIVNDDGTKTFSETMPEGRNFGVSIECDHGAIGVWDYEEWAPLIKNLNDSRTKCSLNFKKPVGTLIDIIKSLPIVTSGEGLYEVSHDDANITYTDDVTQINNLKQTELRYAGSNPDNYVKFNNELWRIIGLVNTPEGQRIKIIRNESIGNFSWDSSASSVNNGYGVNEWSQADLMFLLNSGPYYNRTSGTCYNEVNNSTVPCDFSKIGLTNYAKSMIDTVTWNLGANLITGDYSLNTTELYNAERGSKTGKSCSNGALCTDNITRNLVWNGQVGLVYLSDYGYSSSNQTCISTAINSPETFISSCLSFSWLKSDEGQWTINPYAVSDSANKVLAVSYVRGVYIAHVGFAGKFRPSLYFETDIKVISGNGTLDFPYEIIV